MRNPPAIVSVTAWALFALFGAGCTRAPPADGAGADGNTGNAAQVAAVAAPDAAGVLAGAGFDGALRRALAAAQADEFAAAQRWLDEAEALAQVQQAEDGGQADAGEPAHKPGRPTPARTDAHGHARTAAHTAAHADAQAGAAEAGAAPVPDEHSAPPAERLAQTRALIDDVRRTRIARLHAQGVLALADYGGTLKAAQVAQKLARIAPEDSLAVADLRQRIVWATGYGAFAPGQVFVEPMQSGGYGPQMAVIPAGEFQLGAVAGDADAQANESPQTTVRFERGFALSVFEVTVGEFARFIHATGYQPRAVRRGFSLVYDERSGNFVRRSGVDWRADFVGNPAASDLPVIHVSAHDAKAYADWLGAQTGAVYRLPGEAEFEYVLRAGGSGVYPWPGDAPPPGAGNLTGGGDRSPGARAWANAFPGYADGHWGPAAVGSFHANAFGIHDLAGNVSEWVADCWHAGFRRVPRDGSAWVNPGCRDQVIRGGSWASSPAQTRASWRAPAPVDTTNARIGFRVVRVL